MERERVGWARVRARPKTLRVKCLAYFSIVRRSAISLTLSGMVVRTNRAQLELASASAWQLDRDTLAAAAAEQRPTNG
jgi:hypothetical protein